MTDIESVPGEPIRAESMSSSVGQGDLPVDGGGRIQMVVETPSSQGRKKWAIPAAILLVIIMLATIIGLAVGLTRSKNANSSNVNSNFVGDSKDETPISAPSVAPAVADSNLENVKAFILVQQYSTSASFNSANSPQSKAAKFMAEGPLEVPTDSTSRFAAYKWLEEYALTVFYYTTSGASWISQCDFLNRDFPTCGWFLPISTNLGIISEGVLCSTSERVVDTMQFLNNNLKGSLPEELGLLTALKRIVTINDEISGSIPESFANLKSLSSFQCVRCAIDGTIPDWIGQLSSLQFLFLKDSQISGSFPTSMGGLTNLIELSVENNLMTGDLSAVEGMSSLQYLYAEDNAFAQTIDATFLQELTKLEIVDISDNTFTGQVPVHLMGLQNLTTMDIHGNSLTSFPDAIPENGGLDFLTIFGNPITGPFPSNTIANLVNLDHFDATSTQFTGDMPSILGNMTKLGYLFLADTTFNAGSIPDELQFLTNLEDFSLKDSSRTGLLPTWLGDLDKIVLLDLDSNSFSGPIPTEIANMANIRALLLNRNNLTGEIPTELGFLTDLRIAHFDHNPQLSGSLEPWCSSVVQSTTLIFRAISDCGNTTVLPALVDCPCCTLCCVSGADNDECNTEDFLGSIDPEWSNNYDRADGYYVFRDVNITRRSALRRGLEGMMVAFAATPYGYAIGDKTLVRKDKLHLNL